MLQRFSSSALLKQTRLWKTRARFKTTVLRKLMESDEEFRQLINAKRQKINFPPSKIEDQWEAVDSPSTG